MGLQGPNHPPPTDRHLRRSGHRPRSRYQYQTAEDLLATSQPVAIPLLNGQAGQVIGRDVRNDLPDGGFAAPGTAAPGTPPPQQHGRGMRAGWLRARAAAAGWGHDGDGWPPLPSLLLEDRGPLPWWVWRLLPLLLGATVAGLLRQWPLLTALVGAAGVVVLHHYWVGPQVSSRTVRLLYPAVLIIACLAFASSPLWEQALKPVAASAIRAANNALTRARTTPPQDPSPASSTKQPEAEDRPAPADDQGGGRQP